MTDETHAIQPVQPASSSSGRKTAGTAFGTAIAASAAIAGFLYTKVPPSDPLIAVPTMFVVLTVVLLLMLWETMVERPVAQQIAAWSSCVIWIGGIVCGCIMKPTNMYICLPDMILLAGFFPLLYYWRFSWTWLLFGILNGGIGLLLSMISYLSDSLFPADLLIPKHHLADLHPAISWMLFGFVALIYGIIRFAKNMLTGSSKW